MAIPSGYSPLLASARRAGSPRWLASWPGQLVVTACRAKLRPGALGNKCTQSWGMVAQPGEGELGGPGLKGAVVLSRPETWQRRVGCLVVWSYGQGKLGERCRETTVGVGVGGEFVVAAAKVLDEGMPGADHLGGAETFQPRIGLSRALSRP